MDLSLIRSARIFAAEDVCADVFAAPSPNKFLTITFTERTNRDLDGLGFGTEFLIANGSDVIAIKTNVDKWYQNLSCDQINLINGYISNNFPNKTILGYGSSMGGYAAIRFSSVFNMQRVFALSPLFDIAGDWDTRWSSDLHGLEGRTAISEQDIGPNTEFLFAFDRKCQDDMHFQRISELIPQERIAAFPVPYSGHPCGYFLRHMGALSALAREALFRGCFPVISLQGVGRKLQSQDYCYNITEACIRSRRFSRAQIFNKNAIKLFPRNPEFHLQTGKIFEGLGDLDRAISACSRAAILGHSNPNFALYRDLIVKRQLNT